MIKIVNAEKMRKFLLTFAVSFICISCAQRENIIKNNAIIFQAHRSSKTADVATDLPERMRSVGVGVWIDGYAVDFSAHKITRTEYVRDSMFDMHGFERAKLENFNSSCYVKTVDEEKRTVILVSSVDFSDVDTGNIVQLVDFLWKTDETFFYPAADTSSNLWLKDGNLVKNFLSPAFPPKSQPATLKMLVEEIYSKKTQHCH